MSGHEHLELMNGLDGRCRRRARQEETRWTRDGVTTGPAPQKTRLGSHGTTSATATSADAADTAAADYIVTNANSNAKGKTDAHTIISTLAANMPFYDTGVCPRPSLFFLPADCEAKEASERGASPGKRERETTEVAAHTHGQTHRQTQMGDEEVPRPSPQHLFL